MSLLIDGYNLLHASGILGRGAGPGGFERSRQALLGFLAASLEPEEISHTVIVFDATMAPPGLPRELEHAGIKVRFAPRQSTADDLIAELIKADHSPRRLTVVSSDHQVQRAAKRRNAIAVDSDKWYAEILRRRIERQTQRPAEEGYTEPAGPLSQREIEFWVRQFAEQDAHESPHSETEPKSVPKNSASPSAEQSPLNPFPPGYGEDIGEDDV